MTVCWESFQERSWNWVCDCFGKKLAMDLDERRQRFLEESLETVQAAGCSRETAHALVDYVFDRPIGNMEQEIGGVMLTLVALCKASEIDPLEAGRTELERVLQKSDVIRAKQAMKTRF